MAEVKLPAPDVRRVYPDGAKIWRCQSPLEKKWKACWADGTPLRGDNDEVSFFDSAEEAAAALAEGGEGPAAADRVEAEQAELRSRFGLPARCECGGVMSYQHALGRIFSGCLSCSPVQQVP
jgi:hypothetical protein